jgi:type I restriction enzyme S subunit
LIPLPPLETQKQITKTLDTAVELLALRKQQLTELDELIKSIFYDMFGDPDNNNKSWDINRLGDISEIVSGITKGRKTKEQNLISIPYMRVANVQDGTLNLTEIKKIDVTTSETAKYQLVNGDLLMTEGGDPDKLGRCAIWSEEIKVCLHQNHIFRVRLKKDLIVPQYASFLIGSPYGKKYFLKAAKQTTGIATINSKQLNNFPVVVPPLYLQTRFAELVDTIEKQKKLIQKTIDETQYLFDSLMSRCFE